jgi:hypothetical protein
VVDTGLRLLHREFPEYALRKVQNCTSPQSPYKVTQCFVLRVIAVVTLRVGSAVGSRFGLSAVKGATCDACGEAIPPDQAQYEVVISGHEMRLDRDCFRRRMDELT